ncbi:hypothetical protein EV361DRAFT_848294 [Lentinula raphanica]|nr:hypothetical protein EV361DRAFT_848294 [Lentinula raphanica]
MNQVTFSSTRRVSLITSSLCSSLIRFSQTVSRSVRARIYRTNSLHSEATQVFYREDPRHPEKGRSVVADAELADHKTQPYVHDCVVTTIYQEKRYKFRIFFKHHVWLPINQAILQLAEVEMEGDCLVVACGTKVGVRNLCGNLEIEAAEQAVRRFAQHVAPFRPRHSFPSQLNLE